MESGMISKNISKVSTTSLLSWILIAISIISCYARPDYNIVLGFLILYFRGYNSGDKIQLILRFQLQILLISLMFDVFWILKYNSYWCHGEETDELWQSLSSIHNCAFYLGFIEFLLKIPVIFFIYREFTNVQGIIKDLFLNFDYQPTKI